MVLQRRLFAAGVTLLTAAGIGHFVQNGETTYDKVATKQITAEPAVIAAAGLNPSSIEALSATTDGIDADQASADSLPPMPQDIASQPGPAPVARGLPTRLAALDEAYVTPTDNAATLDEYGMTCSASLTAVPVDAGLVELSLKSCQSDAWVSVFHDLMRFTLRTDASGGLRVKVPAFKRDAAFMVLFADGAVMTSVAEVPSAEDYAHVAVQWSGRNAMQIHAIEEGAEYGGDGHVWAGAPGAMTAGFVTVLGDSSLPEAQVIEVFSQRRSEQDYSVSIEAEVTKANCGREIGADLLMLGEDGVMQANEVTFFMPECPAKGEFLVLKNLPQGRTLAQK